MKFIIRNTCITSPSQMIQDVDGMMIERLQAYKDTSKTLPERVIVYRDGVSEVCNFESSRLINVLRQSYRDNLST